VFVIRCIGNQRAGEEGKVGEEDEDAEAASSSTRHCGHRHGKPGASRSAGSFGIDAHQQPDGSLARPQSNAAPQRGQRAGV
jgi:hypothetical protein